MAIESIVALALATAILVGLALYASNHRAEDSHDNVKKNHDKDEPHHAV